MNSVVVKVPASTANLGPGFDCLGLALGLHNSVQMTIGGPGLQIEVGGLGAEKTPRDGTNLIAQAAAKAFQALGQQVPPLQIKATNRIPLASGMGSSAAAIICGLAAANMLAGESLTKLDLLHLAYELEGHADNAAASIFGGLTLVGSGDGRLIARRVPVGDLVLVVAVPEIVLSTRQMRGVLPETISLADAVFNMANCALTIEALREGDFELLASSMQDRMHQPYRKKYLPAYDRVVDAARQAGAAAVAISGAGPSLIAFAQTNHDAIAQAMMDALQKESVPARTFILPVDTGGVQVRALDDTM